jgi:DNA-directed RNA polymerase specialized sigma24 family protein
MSASSRAPEAARFAETHWSVVATAAESQAPGGAAALEQLCRDYWYPLYAFLRRRGHSPEEAEDLTQGFFAERVVTRRVLKDISPERGKFRSWLLASLQNFVSHEREKAAAQKRGGNIPHVALELPDLGQAEGRYQAEPGHDLTPEKLFDRAWAFTLLDQTQEELRLAYQRGGRGETFAALRGFLPGAGSTRPYAEVAAQLGKSEDALKMAVSRLRQEFGKTLRARIARTVGGEAEVEEELRQLLAVFAG